MRAEASERPLISYLRVVGGEARGECARGVRWFMCAAEEGVRARVNTDVIDARCASVYVCIVIERAGV